METTLIFHIQDIYIYTMIIINSWFPGREYIHISIMNKFKKGMLYLLILYMVHQDHLDQELCKNLLETAHIQTE